MIRSQGCKVFLPTVWCVVIGAAAGSSVLAADEVKLDKKGVAFFETRIRPVLVESCYECHSTRDGSKVKGGLVLESRDGLLRGGESGPAIVPGSPDDSLLIEALRHDGLEMPPNKKLPDQVVADFVTWIKMGAPDPRESTGKEPAVAKKEIDVEAGRQFWAFQPPKKTSPPAVKNAAWPRGDVDKFVLVELEAKKPQNPKKNKNAPSVPAADGMPVEIRVPGDASPEQTQEIKRLGEELRQVVDDLKDCQANAPANAEVAMGARDLKKPADCQLCIRGDSTKRGEGVPRGVVSVATIGAVPAIASDHSGRLELAQWIASPSNPLTARVAVNRIWQHLLGRGLVSTVDNFGELGERPSHPALLDHLALQFVRDGWSTKKMIRTIVLSRTYGLASNHVKVNYDQDPDNIALWRHAPRRLDSDQFRDAILAASGQLTTETMAGSVVSKSPEEVVQQGPSHPPHSPMRRAAIAAFISRSCATRCPKCWSCSTRPIRRSSSVHATSPPCRLKACS